MKFLALLKKELREAAPWAVLAIAVLGLWGWFTLMKLDRVGVELSFDLRWQRINSLWNLQQQDPLCGIGPLLFLTSLGLGLVLAVRQFWIPSFLRTWSFSLHRSVTRGRILLTKSIAAACALGFAAGGVWTIVYLVAARPGFLELPPSARTYWIGWVYIAAGLTAYFATALTALNTTRWYTTRLYPMALATAVLPMVLIQVSLAAASMMLAAGTLLLGAQVVHTFATREF